MKKFLSLLGAFSLVVSPTAMIISCTDSSTVPDNRTLNSLTSVIKVLNLGIFSTQQPTNQEILLRVLQLNKDLDVSQVNISLNKDGKATISVNSNSTIYQQGSLELFYTSPLEPKFSLKGIIKNTDLGIFASLPADEMILTRLQTLNSNLDINQVAVKDKTNDQATIITQTNSLVYRQESVDVNFLIETRIDLTTVLTVTNLGYFTGIPRVKEILDRIHSLNPNVNMNEIQLTYFDDGEVSISVVINSQVYRPTSLILTYAIDTRNDLEQILIRTQLGTFTPGPPTDDLIYNRIRRFNPAVDVNEIQIEEIYQGKIWISVIPNSRIYRPAEMVLTYLANLREIITNPNLGQLATDPTNEEVLRLVKQLNPDLDISQIDVRTVYQGRAEIGVIAGSQIYAPGSFTLSYELAAT